MLSCTASNFFISLSPFLPQLYFPVETALRSVTGLKNEDFRTFPAASCTATTLSRHPVSCAVAHLLAMVYDMNANEPPNFRLFIRSFRMHVPPLPSSLRSHPCLQDPQSQFPCSELNCVVLINISVSEGILPREIRTFSSLSSIKNFSECVY